MDVTLLPNNSRKRSGGKTGDVGSNVPVLVNSADSALRVDCYNFQRSRPCLS